MDPLYFANKILNVSHIRVYIRGNIIYGCLYENIPDKFRNYVQQNVDLHDYNLRNANDVYIYIYNDDLILNNSASTMQERIGEFSSIFVNITVTS